MGVGKLAVRVCVQEYAYKHEQNHDSLVGMTNHLDSIAK